MRCHRIWGILMTFFLRFKKFRSLRGLLWNTKTKTRALIYSQNAQYRRINFYATILDLWRRGRLGRENIATKEAGDRRGEWGGGDRKMHLPELIVLLRNSVYGQTEFLVCVVQDCMWIISKLQETVKDKCRANKCNFHTGSQKSATGNATNWPWEKLYISYVGLCKTKYERETSRHSCCVSTTKYHVQSVFSPTWPPQILHGCTISYQALAR